MITLHFYEKKKKETEIEIEREEIPHIYIPSTSLYITFNKGIMCASE